MGDGKTRIGTYGLIGGLLIAVMAASNQDLMFVLNADAMKVISLYFVSQI